MLNSVLLDVIIGLVFFYLLLSLVLASVNEAVAGVTRLRSGYLEKAMIMLMGNQKFVDIFYCHPLVRGIVNAKEPWLLSFVCTRFMNWGVVQWLRIDRLLDALRVPFLLQLVLTGRPSYLSSKIFARVMVDLLEKGENALAAGTGGTLPISSMDTTTKRLLRKEIEKCDLEEIRSQFSYFAGLVDTLGDRRTDMNKIVKALEKGLEEKDVQKLRSQVGSFAEIMSKVEKTEGNVQSEREAVVGKIAEWFDLQMERVSGWYRRMVQILLFVIALVLTVVLNADTIMMANMLWSDSVVREAVVEEAKATVEEAKHAPSESAAEKETDNPSGEPCTGCQKESAVDVAINKRQQRPFPIGWATPSDGFHEEMRSLPTDFAGWVYKVIGILMTTLLVSLGAPFWFDLLSKLVNLRNTGVKPLMAKMAAGTGE